VQDFQGVKFHVFKHVNVSLFKIQNFFLNTLIFQCIQRDVILYLITLLYIFESLFVHVLEITDAIFLFILTGSLKLHFMFIPNFIYVGSFRKLSVRMRTQTGYCYFQIFPIKKNRKTMPRICVHVAYTWTIGT
jgi:hypothetical protein